MIDSCVKLVDDGTLALVYHEESWHPDKKKRNVLERYGYKLGKTIGESSYSKIKIAHSVKMNKEVAVKIIFKRRLPKAIIKKFVTREINILNNLRHPRVVEIYEAFETHAAIYIIMEYVANGDLLTRIEEHGPLEEIDALRMFRQLLEVVNYLHEQGVYHRDIKLENILLDHTNNTLKLCDFGFACKKTDSDLLNTRCGSYVYGCPEVLEETEYSGELADVWSMGVCLYGMLCGKLPFQDQSSDILRESMKEPVKFTKELTKDCRTLVHKMLCRDPAVRIRIKDIKTSNWLNKPSNLASATLVTPSSSDTSTTVQKARSTVMIRHPETLQEIEHGFACEQRSYGKPRPPTRVTDMLTAVAKCHSSAKNRVIDLCLKASDGISSKSRLYGITGPALNKITSQINVLLASSHSGSEVSVRETSSVASKIRPKSCSSSMVNLLQQNTWNYLLDQAAIEIENELKGLRETFGGRSAIAASAKRRQMLDPVERKRLLSYEVRKITLEARRRIQQERPAFIRHLIKGTMRQTKLEPRKVKRVRQDPSTSSIDECREKPTNSDLGKS